MSKGLTSLRGLKRGDKVVLTKRGLEIYAKYYGKPIENIICLIILNIEDEHTIYVRTIDYKGIKGRSFYTGTDEKNICIALYEQKD